MSIVTIVDYDIGNIKSVQRGVERVGATALLSSDPDEVFNADRVILPGVGAFEDGKKEPTPSELKNRYIVRKSLVASREIRTGDKFNANNVTVKRPGTGISPIHYWDLIGEKASKNLVSDQLL